MKNLKTQIFPRSGILLRRTKLKAVMHKLPLLTGFTRMRGFTLIELLVVIGVLGILSAGILAAIDPLEQLRKGRDTQKRNVSVELVNAITRYNAVQGCNPWNTNCTGADSFTATGLNNIETNVIDPLIAAGELKPQFAAGLPPGADEMYLSADTNGDSSVCFDPESKSISSDPTTIFTDNTGQTTSTTCTASSVCYWCAQ